LCCTHCLKDILILHLPGDAERETTSEIRNEAGLSLDEAMTRFNVPTLSDCVTPDEELLEYIASGIITSHTEEGHHQAVQRVLKKTDVVVYRSSDILSDFDPSFWVQSFCDLFPFGRGGLDEKRAVTIGLEEFVRYCLRLSSRAFAQHNSFLHVAFDVIARHRAMNAVYVHAKLSPSLAESAATADRDALLEHCKYKQARLDAIQKGLPSPRAPPFNQAVHDLYAGISTGMRAYWGSNEEKAEARANLQSMTLFFGQPTIFFTISPCSSTSLQVACLSGNVGSAVTSSLNAELSITKSFLGNVATSNTVACAL
jgi:hypothetical protein